MSFHKYLLLSGLIFFLSIVSFSQNLVFKKITTKDGLPSNHIYNIIQDSKGFLWIATEYGVSRFDGSGFQNYNLKDGLADNEIFKIREDNLGRIWFLSYNGKLSFFHNGIFFNEKNYEVLKHLNFNYYIKELYQDKKQTVWIASSEEGVKALHKDGRIKVYDSRDGKFDNLENFRENGDTIIAQNNVSVISFSANKTNSFLDKNIRDTAKSDSEILCRLKDSKGRDWIGTKYGLYSIYTNTKTTHIQNLTITSILEDNEGNIWITTLGQGIYMVPVISFYFPQSPLLFNSKVFTSISHYQDLLAGGTSEGSIIFFRPGKLQVKIILLEGIISPNKVKTIYTDRKNNIWSGTDNGIFKITGGNKVTKIKNKCSVKDFSITGDFLFFATNLGIYKLHIDSLAGHFITNDRSTSVAAFKNQIAIGGLRGISYLNNAGNFLTEHRISKIFISDNLKIIGTYDGGLYFTNASDSTLKVVKGISGDAIKDIVSVNDTLFFIATNKGINKITFKNHKPGNSISFSTNDGLPTEEINSLFYLKDTLYVASENGIIFFNPKLYSNKPAGFPKIYITDMLVNNFRFNPNENLKFESKNNNLKFYFTGIALSSFGEVKYEYRLTGLESGWTETLNNIVEYRSLSPGKYEFCVRAVSKYGSRSKEIAISSFSIQPPFTKAWWFKFLLAGTVISVVFFSTRFIIKRNKRKNEEKLRLLELEQAALQSQMNPHFLFNTINSIQQFFIIADKRSSLKYLTTFATLMRNFLKQLQQKYISLEDEVNNLNLYVELENLRLQNKIDFIIETSEFKKKEVYLPAMFIQPLVENSILHGLAPLTDRPAKIEIVFEVLQNTVLIKIKDNGIGRIASRSIEDRRVFHTNSAIKNIEERIAILNKIKGFNGNFKINDLFDADGNSFGTEVIIELPKLTYKIIDKDSHN